MNQYVSLTTWEDATKPLREAAAARGYMSARNVSSLTHRGNMEKRTPDKARRKQATSEFLETSQELQCRPCFALNFVQVQRC